MIVQELVSRDPQATCHPADSTSNPAFQVVFRAGTKIPLLREIAVLNGCLESRCQIRRPRLVLLKCPEVTHLTRRITHRPIGGARQRLAPLILSTPDKFLPCL